MTQADTRRIDFEFYSAGPSDGPLVHDSAHPRWPFWRAARHPRR